MKMSAVARLGGKCSICGYANCLDALDFHHKNSDEKEHLVSKLLSSKNEERLFSEVDKCILLCANCHRETHSESWRMKESNFQFLDVSQT